MNIGGLWKKQESACHAIGRYWCRFICTGKWRYTVLMPKREFLVVRRNAAGILGVCRACNAQFASGAPDDATANFELKRMFAAHLMLGSLTLIHSLGGVQKEQTWS